VYAIGNAYAFVEPLESTGLLMISRAISHLVRSFPIGPGQAVMKRFINGAVARDWDRLRWFLAAHYKFNRRLDSRFWLEVRDKADISGLEHALEMFSAKGPLSILPRGIRSALNESTGIFFYGLAGLDCILLGQKVPFPKLEREPTQVWATRRATARDFARRALPQAEALRITWERPEWLHQLVEHPSSWVRKLESSV
jgi:tryptophan halogenase